MYSANTRAFSACSSGAQFVKCLAKKRPSSWMSLRFGTCSVQRSEKTSKSIHFTPVDIRPRKDSEKVGEELTGRIEKKDVVKLINAFSRSSEAKSLATENGIDEDLYQKGFLSFRKYCLESETLPPDLHITLSDLARKTRNIVDIFPYFLRYVRQMFPHLDCMEDLKKIGDISQPASWFLEARAMKRKFYFHCGPTNSGKTYQAVKNFFNSKSGLYCGPLKLLAVELYRKANAMGVSCNLFTGDEVIYSPAEDRGHSSHVSCTIEMCPFDKTFEVAVIDEIQMLRDPVRGWAWTRALLGVKAKEIHICGEESAVNIVDSILCTTNEELEVKKYERLTKLHLDKPLQKLENVRPGDCIVCFNKNDIFSVAKTLDGLGHKVAIVYGNLPPQTKLGQCEKFNDPKDPCNVLVATDAVGMGLNLNIRRVVFYTILKTTANESGHLERAPICVSQALQIAGRAGRYGTEYEEGYVTTLRKSEFGTLESLLSQKPEPVTQAGLLPTIDQIEMFSYYLPKSTFSELIDILIGLSTVDDSLYFMCNLKDFKFLCQMIDHVPLSLRVKFTFCCAPVNRRFHFICVMFVKFAKMLAANQAVTVSFVCENIGWPLSRPTNLRNLADLEIYHEVLELYLWLSNRFEEYFPDAEVVRKIQVKLDELVQEGMSNLNKSGFDLENQGCAKEHEEKTEERTEIKV